MYLLSDLPTDLGPLLVHLKSNRTESGTYRGITSTRTLSMHSANYSVTGAVYGTRQDQARLVVDGPPFNQTARERRYQQVRSRPEPDES